MMVFGVIEFNPGDGMLSLTVRETLPKRLQPFDPVWLYTCTVTGPALSPGSGGKTAVALVGKGTVRLVVVAAVARGRAITVPLRVKFGKGKAKPKLGNPVPAIVKTGGGEGRLE